MKPDEAVKEYQCPGCVSGPFPDCYETEKEIRCSRHNAGTMIMPVVGHIFLGLPKAFARLGSCKDTQISIFKSLQDGWEYDKFNVIVWKHLDKHENTIVRGLSPRINCPWIHIFLKDEMAAIDCLEITEADMEDMD